MVCLRNGTKSRKDQSADRGKERALSHTKAELASKPTRTRAASVMSTRATTRQGASNRVTSTSKTSQTTQAKNNTNKLTSKPRVRDTKKPGKAPSKSSSGGDGFIMSSPKRKSREPLARTEDKRQRIEPTLAVSRVLARKTPSEPIQPPPLSYSESTNDMEIDTKDSPKPKSGQLNYKERGYIDSNPIENRDPLNILGSTHDKAMTGTEYPPPSPLKTIFSPVIDLLRRVSGIAQDSTFSQNASGVSLSEQASKEAISINSAACAVSNGQIHNNHPEDNMLTAPPMNPTTLGTQSSVLTSYIPSSDVTPSEELAQVITELSETPSKDNVSMSENTLHFHDINTQLETSPRLESNSTGLVCSLPGRMSGIAEEADLDISGITSIADTDIDMQYEQYMQYDDDDDDEFNPYLFMADLPPIPKEHTLRPYALPRKTRSSPPITLVLDLDETLVHCALDKVEDPDLVFPVEFNGLNYDVYCRLRPGYQQFLARASKLFEVVIFTASQQVYADKLLNLIDPGRRYIRHRLFRDSCVYVNTNYVKDLGILGRDESKVLLVDNCPQAFAYQQSNGIPIESWYEDKNDQELDRVMSFLETLVGVDDVRPLVETQFKTKEKVAAAKQRFQLKAAQQLISRFASPVDHQSQ